MSEKWRGIFFSLTGLQPLTVASAPKCTDFFFKYISLNSVCYARQISYIHPIHTHSLPCLICPCFNSCARPPFSHPFSCLTSGPILLETVKSLPVLGTVVAATCRCVSCYPFLSPSAESLSVRHLAQFLCLQLKGGGGASVLYRVFQLSELSRPVKLNRLFCFVFRPAAGNARCPSLLSKSINLFRTRYLIERKVSRKRGSLSLDFIY